VAASVVKVKPGKGKKSKAVDGHHPEFRKLLKGVAVCLAKQKKIRLDRSDFEKKYLSLDSKGVTVNPFDDSEKLIIAELSLLKGMARNMFGTSPFRVKFYEQLYFNTNGSGLAAGGIAIDVTALAEYLAAAALFDEFRVVGGEYKFAPVACMTNNTTGLPPCGVVGYDPVDNTAYSTLEEGCQQQDHLVFFKPVQPTGFVALTPHSGHSFHWRVPPGTVTAAANPSTVGTSNWQPTSASITKQPYGYVKGYASNLTVSVTGFAGVMCYHVEFRVRA